MSGYLGAAERGAALGSSEPPTPPGQVPRRWD